MSGRTLSFLRQGAFAGACALLVLLTQGLHGQAITGVIVGTVQDASGAVIEGAKVTATNTATGLVLTTVTNTDGNYTFPNVTPGLYDISAQKAGFSTAVASKSTVELQRTLRVDLTLSVGATT